MGRGRRARGSRMTRRAVSSWKSGVIASDRLASGSSALKRFADWTSFLPQQIRYPENVGGTPERHHGAAPREGRRVLRRRHHQQEPRQHHHVVESSCRAAVRIQRRGSDRQVDPDDHPARSSARRRRGAVAHSRGKPVTHYETMRQHKNGRMVPISLTVSPIYDDAGIVIGASKIARDIPIATKAAICRSSPGRRRRIIRRRDHHEESRQHHHLVESGRRAHVRIYRKRGASGKSIRMLIPDELQGGGRHGAGEDSWRRDSRSLRNGAPAKGRQRLLDFLTVSPIRDALARWSARRRSRAT